MNKLIVAALGGNSISPPGSIGAIPDQYATARITCRYLAAIIENGYEIAITHGNGPQIGNILRRIELSRSEIYPLSLDICVAVSEGGIGYMFQQCMQNEFYKRDIKKPIIPIMTQVLVDAADEAFSNPTKPIGIFYTEEQAIIHQKESGWEMHEDAGRGYRRVIASPQPIRIIDIGMIRRLFNLNCLTISCGGGGIPVIADKLGNISGAECVIDKDATSSILATELGADTLLISTGCKKVMLNFNTPEERELDFMTLKEAEKYLDEGHFPRGSMGPKIQAAVRFLKNGGKQVHICRPEDMVDALKGSAGTVIHD